MKQGTIIKLNLDPAKGHEQSGYRPAVVVSGRVFNQFSKNRVVCPITNTNRNYPAHIPLDARTKTTGFVMCDQIRTIDPVERNARIIENLPSDLLDTVLDVVIGVFD